MNDIPTTYKSLEEDLYNADTITINGKQVDGAELDAWFETYSLGSRSFTGCGIDVATTSTEVLRELAETTVSITLKTDECVWKMRTAGELIYKVGKEVTVGSTTFEISNLRNVA